jgi:phage terminase large subunit-like protein
MIPVPDVMEKERKPAFMTVESAEQKLIKRARTNFYDFVMYMSDGEMPLADHHISWVYHILTNTRTNIVAPRGSGKTNTLNMLMAWWIGNKPWTSNAIVSVSASQAEERLADIQDIILSERFQNVFPHVHMDYQRPNTMKEFSIWASRWKDEEEIIDRGEFRQRVRKSSEADSKSKTLFAFGITSSGIPGKRINGLLIIDDPHDEKNSATIVQRDKVESFVKKSLFGCLTPGSKIVCISTRWAEDDLAGRLMEDKTKDGEDVWKSIEIPAILPNGESYWPSFWPIDRLEDKRAEIGSTMFQLMYMNNPRGLSSGEFSLDMLRNGVDLDNLPDFRDLWISTDIAESLANDADYSVFTLVARSKPKRNKDGRLVPFDYYVLDMWRGRVQFKECMKQLSEFAAGCELRFGKIKGILFEKQGFQKAWADEIATRNPDLKVIRVSLHGRSKSLRMKAVAAKAQSNHFLVNMKMPYYEAMCSEMLSFTGEKGNQDDICDTLSLPFQLWGWNPSGGRAGRKTRGRQDNHVEIIGDFEKHTANSGGAGRITRRRRTA